jgi:hypothetical protein
MSTRCVAGKVLVTATAANDESVPAAVTVATPWGRKDFGSLDPGKKASAAFSTRVASIPAQAVTMTASAEIDGRKVQLAKEIDVAATTCR